MHIPGSNCLTVIIGFVKIANYKSWVIRVSEPQEETEAARQIHVTEQAVVNLRVTAMWFPVKLQTVTK